MVAHLNLHGAFDDQITLLSVVGGQLDIGIEGPVAVLVFYKQRIGDTVLEAGGHVVINHLMGLLDLLTGPGPGQAVGP